ncbi:MAG TPA: AAA family ATPase [Jiangellales bacterium]|nr:AAA family ATPase [Jiangellales bacterium]
MLTARRRRRLVGRSAEIELVRRALDEPGEISLSVLHLHGPGGVGKTTLLDAFADLAVESGATAVRVDGRDLDPSPVAVTEALGDILDIPAGDDPISLRPGAARLVLLVDTYERLAALDDWFRTRFLPRLPAATLTVLAGRDRPSPAWRAEPGWGDLMRQVSLRNLDPDAGRDLLEQAGVGRNLHDRILRVTHGHPLALALVADVVSRGGGVPAEDLPVDIVQALLPRFVDTVPDPRHRHALEACAVARSTDEALLREVLGGDDAHEVFDWLRELSFVDLAPDGLYAHDLARDVLDADLRWRDPEGYRRVFDQVRRHSLARLRASTGRAQQRAIFDLKFLFRGARIASSPVDWGSWGTYYPDRVGRADHEAVLDLVSRWEGDESARIAARWLDRQPDGFYAVRHHDGRLMGVLGLVDLTRASPGDLAADPGARAAWEHAQRRAPPRPGEVVSQCRFLLDREAYQSPSPTMNAAPVLTLQRQLATPGLAWDFLTLAEPERWDAYFRAADIPRAAGADFTVGGRRYGLFAHDFRQVPIEAWTELWAERALARDEPPVTPSEASATYVVLSHPDFASAVRQGLKDLARRDLLARNPLVRTRLVAERTAGGRAAAEALQGLLREAAAALGDHPRDDKLLRAVDRTYLHPAATQEAAAAVLGLPFSTYRRHLAQGVDRIVGWLWDREVYGQERAGVSTS